MFCGINTLLFPAFNASIRADKFSLLTAFIVTMNFLDFPDSTSSTWNVIKIETKFHLLMSWSGSISSYATTAESKLPIY